MRLSRAALVCVLIGACRGPAPPAVAPAPSVAEATVSPGTSVSASARPTSVVARATPRPSAVAPAPDDAALAWLPADTAPPRGVQTAVAASRPSLPRPPPEQVDPRML